MVCLFDELDVHYKYIQLQLPSFFFLIPVIVGAELPVNINDRAMLDLLNVAQVIRYQARHCVFYSTGPFGSHEESVVCFPIIFMICYQSSYYGTDHMDTIVRLHVFLDVLVIFHYSSSLYANSGISMPRSPQNFSKQSLHR